MNVNVILQVTKSKKSDGSPPVTLRWLISNIATHPKVDFVSILLSALFFSLASQFVEIPDASSINAFGDPSICVKGDCAAVAVCQEHESRQRSVNPRSLFEDAALHLHHPPRHDQPGPLSRCVITHTHVGE